MEKREQHMSAQLPRPVSQQPRKSATKDFFLSEIAAALQKAVPLPIESIALQDGKISAVLVIDGEQALTPFWLAALEQSTGK